MDSDGLGVPAIRNIHTQEKKNWYLIIFRNKLYTCLHSPPSTSKELMSRAATYHWCSMYFRVIRISFQHIWQVPSYQPLFPYPSPRNLPRVSSGSSHLHHHHHHHHHHHQWFKGTFRKPHSIGKNKNKQNIWFQVMILPRTNPLTSSSQKWLNNWPQNQLSH